MELRGWKNHLGQLVQLTVPFPAGDNEEPLSAGHGGQASFSKRGHTRHPHFELYQQACRPNEPSFGRK